MQKDNWELIRNVTAEYTEYSDFDFEEILLDFNDDNDTKYTLNDIEDFYIKRNNLALTMIDWRVIEYEWNLSEWDYKRPDKITTNQFN